MLVMAKAESFLLERVTKLEPRYRLTGIYTHAHTHLLHTWRWWRWRWGLRGRSWQLILHVCLWGLWCLMCHVLWCPLWKECQSMCVCSWPVCVCVCAWSKRNLVRRFEGCVALSFSPKTLTPFPLFLQQVSQSDSHDRSICLLLLLSSLQPFSFSPRLLLLPPSSLPLSSLVHGLVLLSICCLPGEKTQRTLYANIHSAIISNLFHTHFGFHSV